LVYYWYYNDFIMYFTLEVKMDKKLLTGIILLLTFGSSLYAQTRLVLPNDPNAMARQGQAEIIINAENADKDIAVWVDGVIVAHLLPKTREKIIVNNGNHQIEAAETTLNKGNWTTGGKKQIKLSANSNSTVIGFTTRYGSLLNLTIQSTAVLAGGGENTPAVSAQPSTSAPQPSASAGSSPTPVVQSGDGTQAFSLETAVSKAAQLMIDNIPANATLAVLSIATNDPDVAEFVIEELAFHMVATKKFRVVDRKSLDAVRAEHSFQISGDVDDNSAISIGKMLGASIVITGSVSGIGATRRLRAKALDVQTAEIVAMASERY
jgi:TolB-like protein